MKKCKLCKKNEADKKGSHIIPHFLMKRIDNEIGRKGRDMEVGFSVGEFDTIPYFGRSVLPEKINDITEN